MLHYSALSVPVSIFNCSVRGADSCRILGRIHTDHLGGENGDESLSSVYRTSDVLLTPARNVFLTHHVYPQVLAYQPEDHGDPLAQPVESNGKWLNDQLKAAFWSDDACCEVSRCGSIICRRVAGDA